MIDEIDKKILAMLTANARASNAEMAREVGLTASSVYERVKKLERRGVIKGYQAVVDPAALELNLLAFVSVTLGSMKTTDKVGERLAVIQGVQEVYNNAGRDCFLLKLRAKDTEQLRQIIMEINALEEVSATNTTIVLKPVKEETSPLAAAGLLPDN